ncbi:inositol monophosphatase family protein [Microcoleus sp. FACHB-68]|uniref:3'(2'),5'-bisphosphate nucleotidase CysQ family protein n=1 Tax=Microcoleus sp. FACHB-68 TaxID=2692826 RepID=UPI001689A555|nr:inositol monophosphatase family protein [Microcoleus sp. FACHB-68]MBD1937918.1 inositol monophosphatase family protein [Microcoleus sp. FACHB-68]
MKSLAFELEQQIRQLMRSGGQQAAQMAKEQFQVAEKGPDDYVTSVDRWLDRHLATAFAKLFPHEGIITEENEQSRTAFGSDYSRLWLIDPLDGTEDFIQGQPHYAVMVGLLSHHEPIAGWIYAPAEDRLYYGGRDWGLFQTAGDAPPQPLPVKEPLAPSSSFCPVIVGTKDQRNFGSALTQLIPEAQFYSLGSFGLKVLEVIQGRAGLYIYLNRRVKLWDTTGPIALAKAAQLTCCDLEGRPLSFQPDAIDPATLAHKQTIVIGWPHYVESLLPRIQKAVAGTTA